MLCEIPVKAHLQRDITDAEKQLQACLDNPRAWLCHQQQLTVLGPQLTAQTYIHDLKPLGRSSKGSY